MTVYLITYDLNSPGQKYDKLYDEIKSFGEWAHYLESVWFVNTNLTIQSMNERLKKNIDTNDQLFITQVTSNYYGYASTELWDWLNTRV